MTKEFLTQVTELVKESLNKGIVFSLNCIANISEFGYKKRDVERVVKEGRVREYVYDSPEVERVVIIDRGPGKSGKKLGVVYQISNSTVIAVFLTYDRDEVFELYKDSYNAELEIKGGKQ